MVNMSMDELILIWQNIQSQKLYDYQILQKSNFHVQLQEFQIDFEFDITFFKDIETQLNFFFLGSKLNIILFLPFSIWLFHFVAQPLSCLAQAFSISALSWISIDKSLHNLLPSSIRLVVRLKFPGSQKESEPAIKFSSL